MIRQRLRKIVAIGGTGAVLMVVLFAIASFTRLWYVAGIAAIIGITLIAACCVFAIRFAEYSANMSHRASTRVKNLESRERQLAARIQSLEQIDIVVRGRVSDLEKLQLVNLQKFDEILEFRGQTISEIVRIENQATGNASQVSSEITEQNKTIKAQAAILNDLSARQTETDELAERNNRDLRVLRSRVSAEFKQEITSDLNQLKATSHELEVSARDLLRVTFESSLLLGQNPSTVLSVSKAKSLLDDYIEAGDFVRTGPLIENFDLLDGLRLTELRVIYRGLRASGYWKLAARVLGVVVSKTQSENDTRALGKIEHEILAYKCSEQEYNVPVDDNAYNPEGPIMHMVGRVLPQTQTGYTLRTQYTANAQARRGLPVVVVGQPGITEHQLHKVERYRHDDIDYYLLPGKSRKYTFLDEWLLSAIEQLSSLVQELRPSILHAQSDFLNALIAQAVGNRFGIPTVYESRGFWEESWLSRTIDTQGWDEESDRIFEVYGFPDAYTLRQRAEEIVRERADHVFTLAEVMREHIVESSNGAIDPTQVSIVPNAVEPTNFPVQSVDLDLKISLGIPVDTVVVGYISSIVEYEGIDTLLDAYHRAVGVSESPMCLLLVGDGDYLPTLKDHAAQCGIQDVFFIGRVPHSDVLRYYGLIDIFVVPRKPAAVSELVTPLKPFEAFATGRAVILSDVGALQEIARQSQAVESFVAGDSESLTQKLLLLANDPEYRADLSQRAAAWVRNYRTWDNNVCGYLDVYRQLGYEGTSSQILESELRLRQRGMNAGDIIDKVADAESPPLTGWFVMQEPTQKAQDILANGWVFAEFAPVFVASSLDWNSYSEEHRSWGFHLHAFEFMDPFLREFDETEDRIWLDAAVDIALSWLDVHCAQEPLGDSMAWYDMSLALRTPRLLRLLSLTSRFQDLRSSSTILIDGILRHIDELKKDEAFNAGNNHGFYTAAAQLHLARFAGAIPGSHEAGEFGERRMRIMAERQFAADGVHLEHSPDYHRMLLSSFESAIHDGLIHDVEVSDRIQRAKYVLSWMIQPNGHLVQFGDTPSRLLEFADVSEPHPETEFLISGGDLGQAPTSELAVFEDGGYAFVRYPAPTNGSEISSSSYLALSAAFHSRAHKHADDLNFVWFDQGVEILVDSGRFGYGDLLPADSQLREQGFYYATPERQYVEGTMAHNTLMMDGLDQSRRDRKAYGSGILECTQKDNVFDLSARVSHEDYIHRRRIVLRPGQEVQVLDSVFSQTEKIREATIWFNLDGNFELVSSNGKVVFQRLIGGEQFLLEITGPGELIEPVRGGEAPLRGWRSRIDRQLEPVWSIGFRVPVETRASVSTRFRIIR